TATGFADEVLARCADVLGSEPLTQLPVLHLCLVQGADQGFDVGSQGRKLLGARNTILWMCTGGRDR
ncbi:hypothetical protein, partial [Streptomyces pseudogriseolus]|uniref:hypothetical protein n=1 Tax=Streptomyces pseudogriseolus TaxID=36817 RepID=UPI003FA2B1C3